MAHRALLAGSLASGTTFIQGVPRGDDIQATLRCLSQLGISWEQQEDAVRVTGAGSGGFRKPVATLDCGGSATTMRLMMGLLAGRADAVLTGDSSLRRRPMDRVAIPLTSLGVSVRWLEEAGHAPLEVSAPSSVVAARVHLELPSAQVKTAVILAALGADEGHTVITGAIHTRDHMERLLPRMGGVVVVSRDSIAIQPGPLHAIALSIPGDPSSAAFLVAATALAKHSELTVSGISINPTRWGFFEALSWMGAHVEQVSGPTGHPEPVGSVHVRWRPLKAINVPAEAVPGMVDEVPLLFLLATQADGETRFSGISELRRKESDRLDTAVTALRSMGAEIDWGEDWAVVRGPTPLRGAVLDPRGDHRMSMMLSLAALAATGTSQIKGIECEGKSFPGFWELVQRIVS
jgi:3-phosphoshikimate 1-carboxyvinyltransferase